MTVLKLFLKRTIFFFLLIPLLVSCFELVEDIRFNKNDSGTAKITFNGSKSKNRIDNIMEKDSMYGRPVPGTRDIVNKLEQLKNVLNKVEGVHDVDYTTDFNQYVFSLSYNFDSPEALNKAVEVTQQQYEAGQLSGLPVEIKKTDKKFSRTLSEDYLKKLSSSLLKKGLFEVNNAKITLMYHFDHNIIRQTSVPSARISSNKKSVVIQHTLQDMLEKQQFISMTIDFL